MDATDGDGAPAALDTTKLAAARLWATTTHPYLAAAVFASPVAPAPGLGRLVIDRWWRVHADPDVVAAADVDDLGGELLHLATHVLRDHATRADAVGLTDEAELHHWVDAADAEINDDLPTDLPRVSERVAPDDLGAEPAGLAEEYYRRGLPRDGSTNDCGSGAHGHAAGWEPPPPEDDPTSNGVDEHDQELIRRRVANDVRQAEADAVAGSLRRWADDVLGSRVRWQAELAGVLRRSLGSVAGAVDYSYQRPSRRHSVAGTVVLPSMRRPTVEVAVVCDTSASVSDHQLGVVVAEVDELLRASGIRSVRVLAVDTAVRTVTSVTAGRNVQLLGGGGTDLTVGVEAAVELQPRPQVVVVLTDGFTPWPVQAPAVDVVVGLLESEAMVEPTPPPSWARTVAIPLDVGS